MDSNFRPRCIAQIRQAAAVAPVESKEGSFKSAQWSNDGTSLIVTCSANSVHVLVVPADLLAEHDEPLGISSYCTIPSSEPVNAVVGFSSFQLQDPNTTLLLSSVREHPIRLNSALTGKLVASYPLVNPMTEEFISPHSLAFCSTGAQFVAGSESLISTFDISRPGQEPIAAMKTGPKHSKDDRWNPAASMRGIVSALAIEPASRILATGTFTRQVALYESEGQAECAGSFTIAGNEADGDIGGSGITQLHWSQCGRYIYIAERRSDGIMIYDIRQTGQLLSWTTGRNARTNQRLGVDLLNNANNGSYELWAGGVDGKVRLWEDAHLKEGAVETNFEFETHKDGWTFGIFAQRLKQSNSSIHTKMAEAPHYPTRLLYQEQGDLYQHGAKILAIEPALSEGSSEPASDKSLHIVYLDQTVFHVQGGGQPADLGTIKLDNAIDDQPVEFNVTTVRQADKGVQHVASLPIPSPRFYAPGLNVTLAIDQERRSLNSRLHTAGHVLGVAVMDLSRSGQLPPLVETKANHAPGQAGVEFEGLIEGKFKDLIQKRTDEVVKEARGVNICFWSREECQAKGIALPEKMADTEGQIYRAVDIDGYGAYACGGTHVHDTSGVGSIVVKKISRSKGTTRVSYDVR